MSGDIAGSEDEPQLEAARRELFEETGYRASRWTELHTGFTSPGLTDEEIVFYLAEDLEKAGEGGGDASESIYVHEIAVSDVMTWLASREAQGAKVDLKVFAGIYLANTKLGKS